MTFRGFAPSITINYSYHHQYTFQLTLNTFKFQTNKTLFRIPFRCSPASQHSSPYFLILCFHPSLLNSEQSGFCLCPYTEIEKIFFSPYLTQSLHCLVLIAILSSCCLLSCQFSQVLYLPSSLLVSYTIYSEASGRSPHFGQLVSSLSFFISYIVLDIQQW